MQKITRVIFDELLFSYARKYRKACEGINNQALDEMAEIRNYLWDLIQEGNESD